jgi:serpin B
MNGDAWRRITKPGFTDEDGDLELPKFKIEYSVELAKPLEELGMTTAFDTDKANFSGISSEPLYISAALQKTFVEVKEEGTEAAAVTGLSVAAGAFEMPPPKRFQMIVDHPFLFLIEDNQTGTILFIGLIYDPTL